MDLHNQNWLLTAMILSTLLPIGCSAEEVTPKSAQQLPPVESKDIPATPQNRMFVKNDHLQPVYFEKGSQLDPKSLELLKANADWLKEDLPAQIEVAGFSDERGTPEQNLAMGQRRAAALREFYVAMGIPRSRIVTVTYGQEQPVCFESTDDCMSKNRRADTYIENKSVAWK